MGWGAVLWSGGHAVAQQLPPLSLDCLEQKAKIDFLGSTQVSGKMVGKDGSLFCQWWSYTSSFCCECLFINCLGNSSKIPVLSQPCPQKGRSSSHTTVANFQDQSSHTLDAVWVQEDDLSHLGPQEFLSNFVSHGSQGMSVEVGPEIPGGSHCCAQPAQHRFSFSLPLLQLLGKSPPAMPLAAL